MAALSSTDESSQSAALLGTYNFSFTAAIQAAFKTPIQATAGRANLLAILAAHNCSFASTVRTAIYGSVTATLSAPDHKTNTSAFGSAINKAFFTTIQAACPSAHVSTIMRADISTISPASFIPNCPTLFEAYNATDCGALVSSYPTTHVTTKDTTHCTTISCTIASADPEAIQ